MYGGNMIQEALTNNLLSCPKCNGAFTIIDNYFQCYQCQLSYYQNEDGYYNFATSSHVDAINSTNDEYVHTQLMIAGRFYEEFLINYLNDKDHKSLLDVGCGIGKVVTLLREDGFEAFGLDLPNLSKFWRNLGNDPRYFFCGDAINLPFLNGQFDLVFSFGVIEHIGTINGHCTLMDNYQELRQQYANELLRVIKPGGKIILSCPNKGFPIDFHHGVTDAFTPNTLSVKLRTIIFDKTKVNFHKTWGKYHLLSYSEVTQLFGPNGSVAIEALPLKGFLGYSFFKKGLLRYLKKAAVFYLETMPKCLRKHFCNPYMLVLIIK
jgi:SAM-dependent methyltransferase